MGLPFESEVSILKHLANFLTGSMKRRPTHILFNGGVFKAPIFQKCVLEALEKWFSATPQLLKNSSLDHAVAKGAAYYGKTRRGEGEKIEAGTLRTFYLALEGRQEALVLLPRGVQEGTQYLLPQTFSLLPNAPVLFSLLQSHVRLEDQWGEMISIKEEEMSPLPRLETVLRYGTARHDRIPVRVGIHFTEVGTLDLWVESVETAHKWQLSFQLRTDKQEETRKEKTFEMTKIDQAKAILTEAFLVGHLNELPKVLSAIEESISLPRLEWPPSLLRALFDVTLKQAEKREISSGVESRFWNFLGFFLRPGCGYPVDDFRVKELWKILLIDFKKKKTEEVMLQQAICYRRIVGGLSKGQQTQLFNELFALVASSKGEKKSYAFEERMRTLASLEGAEMSLKIKLGRFCLEKLRKNPSPVLLACLARIATRRLLWSDAPHVIAPSIVETWVDQLLEIQEIDKQSTAGALVMMGCKSDVRIQQLSVACIKKMTDYFLGMPQEAELKEKLLKEPESLNKQEKERLFGDHLPQGLELLDRL